MFQEILFPVMIVGIIGLLAGVGLAVAAIVMAVPVDRKAQAIKEALPGANCGACGYSGCEGYAKALSEGSAPAGLCSPGGAQVAEEIASILGTAPAQVEYKTALVRCNGTTQNTGVKMEYDGLRSCSAASMFYGGTGKCSYGCIGYGDCVAACEYGAIQICNGVAVINPARCKGCNKCVTVCPKHIIELVSAQAASVVRCHNQDKGGETRKQCSAGCIGCMRCVKACEFDAVHVKNFLATVDYDKCTGCGKCNEVCPVGCISILKVQEIQENPAIVS